MNPLYKKIAKRSLQARILTGISSLLEWDQETYMPIGSSVIRGEQCKTIAGIVHRSMTCKSFGKHLGALIDLKTGKIQDPSLSWVEQANLREWRRDYLKQTALPSAFVEKFAKLTSEAQVAWREAKNRSEYRLFLPFLEKIVVLSRQKAELLGYREHPYDALLDLYEPELTVRDTEKLFSTIGETLRPLIQQASLREIDDSCIHGSFEEGQQIAFAKQLLSAMGFDTAYGRLDFSSHPFSSASHPQDSRITTRLHPTNILSGIFVVLHEAGHGLYEMGLPIEWYGTPAGDARSLGMHESQSRFWETRIGQSQPFWSFFFPKLQALFPKQLGRVAFSDFYRALRMVRPSLIRVEADELTYPMHVILRFEIEKQLIEGTLSPKDLPESWSLGMQKHLGITPPSDQKGCLQDIHWSMGGFGYFPSYTLGNVYAAHLFEQFTLSHPDWEPRVAQGQLRFIQDWLHERIYRHGKTQSSLQLLQISELSATPYLRYLEEKYADHSYLVK